MGKAIMVSVVWCTKLEQRRGCGEVASVEATNISLTRKVNMSLITETTAFFHPINTKTMQFPSADCLSSHLFLFCSCFLKWGGGKVLLASMFSKHFQTNRKRHWGITLKATEKRLRKAPVSNGTSVFKPLGWRVKILWLLRGRMCRWE